MLPLFNGLPTGLILLDKAALITDLTPRAADLLGADTAYLLKKPFSLFIVPDDQAHFFINRSRVFAGILEEPFDLGLKRKDGAVRWARIGAQPVALAGEHLPGMLLAVEDITDHRQSLEALQRQEDLIRLLRSLMTDLATWATPDIDGMIVHVLGKIGLAAGADRAYLGLFHDHRTRFSITHAWLGETLPQAAAPLAAVDPHALGRLLAALPARETVAVSDVAALAPEERQAHTLFHPPTVKALLIAPLYLGRRLLGLIGCDTVGRVATWSGEIRHLVSCVGDAIVLALLRRQIETAPGPVREALLGFGLPSPPPDGPAAVAEAGPVAVADDPEGVFPADQGPWRLEEANPAEAVAWRTVPLVDGKTAHIACSGCHRQRPVDIAEIRAVGSRFKAVCHCGQHHFVRIELRREFRKAVRLEGVFLRASEAGATPGRDDWGDIVITNLSRQGIAFTVFNQPKVCVNDRLRIKFVLDNTARSIIQKTVRVRWRVGDAIGCQFEGQDPCDASIGFYVMH